MATGLGKGLGALAAIVLALAGCAPASKTTPTQAWPAHDISPESAALAEYYRGVQQALLSQGLLRTDGGDDLPFDAEILARNFLKIALYEEHSMSGLGKTPVPLTRWANPIRIKLHFGDSVPQPRQDADRARISSYLARLSRLTSLPISLVKDDANFFISIASAEERRSLGPMIRTALPQAKPSQLAWITNLDPRTYCLVMTQSKAENSSYERAFAFIPAEHPDLMRLACIHEEIAQALGLPNDEGTARPSIFNDGEEFALLTKQDEMMLRILYHPSLSNGMTEAELRSIVLTLARQLLGNNS